MLQFRDEVCSAVLCVSFVVLCVKKNNRRGPLRIYAENRCGICFDYEQLLLTGKMSCISTH